MFEKWGTWGRLRDPAESIPEKSGYPSPYYPMTETDFFADVFGRDKVSTPIVPPGTIVEERIEPNDPHKKVVKKKMEHWGIGCHGRYEKLTKENCPRSISIRIEIQPWFSKATVEKKLMEEFGRAFQTVRDAQRAIFEKPYLPHFDEETFNRIMMAYDLRTADPPLSLTDIAIKVLPDETEKNIAHKRRTIKSILPKPSAKDKVRYYLRMADKLINKNGWRYL